MTNPGGEGGMGGGMGGLPDLGNMMGMIQKAQQQAAAMKKKMDDELANKTVEATSGGGMVTVTATGTLDVRSVTIDPSVIDPNDKEMLEDLVTSAINATLKKAKALQAEAQQGQLGNMLGGMGGGGMPDLGQLLGGM